MKTISDDLQMMKSPDRWPLWPVLPLKRRYGDPFAADGLGFVWEGEKGVEPKVQIGMIFMAKAAKDAKIVTYDSLEHVAQVWRVD